MRISSYNIRKAVGLDWRRDPERIVEVLAEIGADIVILQEADKRLGRRVGVLPLAGLHERLGLTLAPTGAHPSHGWHGNAVFYPENWPAPQTDCLPLPQLEPRGALHVSFTRPRLEIIATHLGLLAPTRTRQLRHLYQRTGNTPLLLAGDFNEPVLHRLARNLPQGAQIITPGPSFHARKPVVAFDRFILFGPLQSRKSWVHSSPLARRASDHLPVVIEVDL